MSVHQIFNKYDVKLANGWKLLRIESNGGLMWTR